MRVLETQKKPEPCGPGLIDLKIISQAFGLAEVALEQAGESLAVASFVASHLVHGVVDGIEAGGLGTLGKIGLAFLLKTNESGYLSIGKQ